MAISSRLTATEYVYNLYKLSISIMIDSPLTLFKYLIESRLT